MITILPTDTCYGLAGSFTKEDFININLLKGRDDTKRLALLVEDFADMKKYVITTEEQIEFLKNYPHPWSFLGKRNPEYLLPDFLDGEKYEKISIRVAKVCLKNSPPDKGELEGVTQKGIPYNITPPNLPFSGEQWNENQYPFLLTSANLSGEPESTTLEEAQNIFPGIPGIDGGSCNRPPSDIFSIGANGELEYLRRNYGLI